MVTVEPAAANMEFRIKNPEMFSARRKLKRGTFVGFEGSESEGIRNRDGHVLSPQDGKIDQMERAALYDSSRIQEICRYGCRLHISGKIMKFGLLAGVQIMIIGVHLTGISEEGAGQLLVVADIVTACAPKYIRV